MSVYLKNRYKLLDFAEQKGIPSIYDLLSKLQPMPDQGVACTDGKTIYINVETFEDLVYTDQFFILCHEMLHILYNHHKYSHDKYPDRELLNICQDVVINEYLYKRLKYKPALEGLFLDNVAEVLNDLGYISGSLRYHGQLTTEGLYEYLSRSESKARDIKTYLKSDQDIIPQQEDADSMTQETMKDLMDALRITEDHLRIECGQDIRRDLTPKSKKYQFNKSCGVGSVEHARVDKQADTVLDKTEIIKFVKQFVGTNAVIKGRSQTYTRPNRRIQSHDYVMKGYKHTKTIKNIVIYLDISGSMDQQFVTDMYNTLKALYQTTKFELYTFDYSLRKEEMQDHAPYTGGGTNINNVLKHIDENNIDVAIMITDCEDSFTLKNVKHDLLVFTNNRQVKTANPKVRLAYWRDY